MSLESHSFIVHTPTGFVTLWYHMNDKYYRGQKIVNLESCGFRNVTDVDLRKQIDENDHPPEILFRDKKFKLGEVVRVVLEDFPGEDTFYFVSLEVNGYNNNIIMKPYGAYKHRKISK